MTDYFYSNPIEFLILSGILGTIVGSFLNVIIYRLPLVIMGNQLSLWAPRSFCPYCKKLIPSLLNIPVISYLLLRARSHCCKQIIPLRYLVIETLAGLLSVSLALYFGLTAAYFFSFIFTCALIALAFIDLDTQLLPDEITLPILWVGLVCNAFSLFSSLRDAVLGAILGYLFFYIIASITQKIRKIETLGRGDFKLLAMLGAWLGWQLLPMIVFAASLIGVIFGITYIISTKQKITTPLPFGPFLAISGLIMLFWGQKIFNQLLCLVA